jgi:hypothetical protein
MKVRYKRSAVTRTHNCTSAAPKVPYSRTLMKRYVQAISTPMPDTRAITVVDRS